MSVSIRWRVRRDLMLAKAAGAVAFGALAVVAWVSFDKAGAFLAAGAAVLLGVLALRDVVAPERLAADHTGLTVVSGFADRRRLAWAEVERTEVREHTRYGLRWRLLEIETEDDLYQFGAHELGVPCADAAAELASLRSGPEPTAAPVPSAGTAWGNTAWVNTPSQNTAASVPGGTPVETRPDNRSGDRADWPPDGERDQE
ncbi:PH domain-containing protein [Thermopolyspora sp. NPDC052614]|uniref:PH domain-containing protein n=1 Tax=Thermopolyspora sp. NPDC052614 TaxID=3155682 RepID=UPI0034391ED7